MILKLPHFWPLTPNQFWHNSVYLFQDVFKESQKNSEETSRKQMIIMTPADRYIIAQ